MDTPKKDYTDPMVHVRELVADGLMELTQVAIILGVWPRPKSRGEALARSAALRLIMERFPEIDWGETWPATKAYDKADLLRDTSTPAPPSPSVPTGDIAIVPEPIGFKEDCDCPPCREYRTFRDRTLN